MTRFFQIEHLLGPAGWLSPGFLVADEGGTITGVHAAEPAEFRRSSATTLRGFAVPGMANLHSHAFQRGMAGRAEHRSRAHAADSFWTWRETMYDFAQRIGPEELEGVAGWLFVEMLKAGTTAVGEFHYLHHQPDGTPYADPAETSRRIFSAARSSGIRLTHLPALYMHGGIEQPIGPRQRRFAHAEVDRFLDLALSLPADRTGIALHSVRAVAAPEIRAAVDGVRAARGDAPIHIHVAEQQKEVEECLARLGTRPVRWLFDHADVDRHWCLVHATHTDGAEIDALARSGAVAGLCPTTEANLGDGVFPLPELLAASGRFGVGTDSNVSVAVAEELRLLEYGQRLAREERNVAAGAAHGHVGRWLWESAARGGARALGQPIGVLEVGRRADFVVLDAEHPRLLGHGPDTLLDAFVFSSDGTNPVRDVIVGGEVLVRGGRHANEDELRAAFEDTMRRLVGT